MLLANLTLLDCLVIRLYSRLFHRLSVDRPGHYTVRMTVVMYHEDDRRGDGVELGLEDLLKVRGIVVPLEVLDLILRVLLTD